MMNTIKLRISLLTLPVLFLLGSCSENWALREETFLIASENENWVPVKVEEESFIMTDTLGISYGFVMESEYYYLDKSWGGFLGLNTHMTHTEYRSRGYVSTYGQDYSIAVRAATWEPYGDELRVEVMDLVFRYDLLLEMVTGLDTPFYMENYIETSEGYEYDNKILSTCAMLDSLSIGERIYENVLQFRLLDQPDKWDRHTPVSICIAKGVGLIEYTLNNGITYRLSE